MMSPIKAARTSSARGSFQVLDGRANFDQARCNFDHSASLLSRDPDGARAIIAEVMH
jgi:hypothetical protein